MLRRRRLQRLSVYQSLQATVLKEQQKAAKAIPSDQLFGATRFANHRKSVEERYLLDIELFKSA